jgi:transcriptional regulator with PAS, ATPase and Fis domain
VLISGETGTGKEVFARALHRASNRAEGPFVVVNCAAIPAQLFEAELFGYRRGAFTGATRNHAGIVREADRGVLFLDEIGELPVELQPKLLRVLQERTVRAIGDDRDHRVDVRVVAATNRDLELEVSAGRFRADLYWRLNVVEVSLPPLRDRSSDISPLARHFLTSLGRADQTITEPALRLLATYAWPGNVRELQNVIQRASILARDAAIEPKHLPERLFRAQPRTQGETLAEKRRTNERDAIAAMLRETGSNLTHAAERLGLTRQGLQFKLKQLGLTRDGHRRRQRKG